MAHIARLVLLLITCPLLGAHGLGWAGSIAKTLWIAARGPGSAQSHIALLDLAGSLLGLVAGVVFALVMFGLALKPHEHPARAVSDTLVLFLAIVFLAVLIGPRAAPEIMTPDVTGAAAFVFWTATCAAAWRAAREVKHLDHRRGSDD